VLNPILYVPLTALAREQMQNVKHGHLKRPRTVVREGRHDLAIELRHTFNSGKHLIFEQHGHLLSRRQLGSMKLQTRKRGQLLLLSTFLHLLGLEAIIRGSIKGLRSGQGLAIEIN